MNKEAFDLSLLLRTCFILLLLISNIHTTYVGELRYPAEWPQCSATVSCGPPPAPPLNGTRVWLQGAEGDEDYDSSIE